MSTMFLKLTAFNLPIHLVTTFTRSLFKNDKFTLKMNILRSSDGARVWVAQEHGHERFHWRSAGQLGVRLPQDPAD